MFQTGQIILSLHQPTLVSISIVTRDNLTYYIVDCALETTDKGGALWPRSGEEIDGTADDELDETFDSVRPILPSDSFMQDNL
jgi:hypothetical protein